MGMRSGTDAKPKIMTQANGEKRFERYGNYNHKIGKMWNNLLDRIREIDPKFPKSMTSNISKTVSDFESVDFDGQAFRYAESINWEYFLPGMEYINFLSIAESFELTRVQLSQLSCWIDSMIEVQYINPKKKWINKTQNGELFNFNA